MNLFPWRSAWAKQKLFADCLYICFFSASVALVLEIGLGCCATYGAYFSWKTQKLDKKISQQKSENKIATTLQSQVDTQQQKLGEIQNNQAEWKNKIRLLMAVENQKPSSLLLLHLQVENDLWVLQGNAQTFPSLENYQKNLLLAFKHADISQWQPNNSRNISNFELTLNS